MSYEVVNKDLMIEACGIGDLTLDQIERFLRLWGDDSSISTLTLFAKKNGVIVLNKDNPKYEFYKDLVENYLQLEVEERKAVEVPEGVKETINVLEQVLEQRRVNKMVDPIILGRWQNVLPSETLNMIMNAVKENYPHSSVDYWMWKMLQFGYVYGKREERAKKRRRLDFQQK